MSHSYLVSVEKGVSVLDPALGPDTMAVLGAMASRAPDLVKKINQTFEAIMKEEGLEEWDFANPPERIRRFIVENVQGYGHASIASMAKGAWVLLEGFGWPMAWLLEDTPLFDGQEISTRAVDATRIQGAEGPGTLARLAHPSLAPLHKRWLEVYEQVKAEAEAGAWKFDDARVYLPGTIPTGVVFTQDVRAIARHLDHIRALGGEFEELSRMGYAALSHVSPVMTKAIGHRQRRPLQSWRYEVAESPIGDGAPAGAGVSIVPWDFPATMDWDDLWKSFLDQVEPREKASTHLDPIWRTAPRFELKIPCSVAAARDFHRHRPIMPWSFTVHTEKDSTLLQMAPWYSMKERLPEGLLADTTEAFFGLRGSPFGKLPTSQEVGALHALPFGTLITLRCVATLPELLYMLELRATTQGANAEYRAQAREALTQLCEQLPREVVEAEKIDGALKALNISHPI